MQLQRLAAQVFVSAGGIEASSAVRHGAVIGTSV
jgi:hypothetical protein